MWPSSSGDGGSSSSNLGDRWFEVLQACGHYGAWAAAGRVGIQLAAARWPVSEAVRRRAAALAPPCHVTAPFDPCHCTDLCCPAPLCSSCLGDPPSYRRWGIQLAEWVACVVLARAMCGTIVVLLGSALVHVAQVKCACGLECVVGCACLLAEQLADWKTDWHFAKLALHLTSGRQPNSPALGPPPCPLHFYRPV